MLAFELYVNGTPQYTAGVGEEGCLQALVSWLRRDLSETEVVETLSASIRGLGVGEAAGEWLDWPSCELRVGDEVTVKVIDGQPSGPPETRTPFDIDTGEICFDPEPN